MIRRVYFDLIGLPPDEAEFTAAADDRNPDWLSSLVSKLLASPHFGEKWGRHWLDVARYGEDDFSGTAVIPYPTRGDIAIGWCRRSTRICRTIVSSWRNSPATG